MHVILHTGAHHTDEDRLMKCLLRNKEDFSKRAVAIPGPGKYRSLLKESFKAMQSAPPSSQAREVLIDAILDEETAGRVILSNAHFFGSQRFAVFQGQLYPLAGERLTQLNQLFHSDKIEIFMALRNPALFLPAILAGATPQKLDESLAGRDPRELRWSDTIARIQTAAPAVTLNLWCHEDTPLIWAEIIRKMAGLEPNEKITGGFDLLGAIMSNDGMSRFRAYLQKHPNMNEAQKRRVIAAFLSKFALEDKVEEELDLPGWTDALVDEMTEIYDADVQQIQQMPGVRMMVA